MVKVVIAEKPSVGRDIARVLGARTRHEGYLSGNGYIVTWAIGHLVHYAEPDDYGPRWRGRWSFSQLPITPENWRLKTHKDTVAQFRIIQKLINDPQTSELICATDAGREGEHIFRLIYRHAQCRKPFSRLWISSLTEESIARGFREVQPGHVFDHLADAARARAQADWLVGMNLTRAHSVRHGGLFPVGRVQTPTLAMIVKREEIIGQFKKAFFYEIAADLEEGFQAKYQENGETRIDEKARAQRLYRELSPNRTGTVLKLDKKTKRYRPPPLYDLTGLQKDANRRFGMTAAMVLKHAQALYETHKLITYPRTESRHIAEDMVPQLPGILRSLEHPMAGAALDRLASGHRLSKAYVDRTKLSDHHGILPTGRKADERLTPPQRKVYQLIVNRFIAIFLPDHVVAETKVTLQIGEAVFVASGAKILDQGWKAVDPPPEKSQKKELPPLKPGQTVHIRDWQFLEKETKPPKRFTDSTLLTAMKNAGREVEDDALAEAMKESGLGTPATRAEIIEKLIRTRLIEREKKALIPTEKGVALIGIVAEPLKSPETTGAWEQKLKEIENGVFAHGQFYQEIVDFIVALINGVKQAPVLALPKNANRAQPSKNQAVTASGKSPESKGVKRIGSCPSCGEGVIIEGNKAYGCTRYRQGCRFLIDKMIQGRKLTRGQVTDLVNKGETKIIKGFKTTRGEAFPGRLKLDPSKKVVLTKEVDSKTAPVTSSCPLCAKGRIIEGKRGFGCNRFREGCGFVVWKEIAGKKLTRNQIQDLIVKGKTRLISGFKRKDGESFKAKLERDDAGKVSFI